MRTKINGENNLQKHGEDICIDTYSATFYENNFSNYLQLDVQKKNYRDEKWFLHSIIFAH